MTARVVLIMALIVFIVFAVGAGCSRPPKRIEAKAAPAHTCKVTSRDLKALMDAIAKRDAAQDNIILGLVSRMDVKQVGVGR